MKPTLPNFLIVGAAKSGTTSLYHYFDQHPEIYMSPEKEPKFITAQFRRSPINGPGGAFLERTQRRDFKQYKALFEGATKEKAIGEASADYLYYYKEAVPLIKEYLGDVKVIMILRNPVDRAYSSYTHLIRDNKETYSFEEALNSEDKRQKDNWDFLFYYKDVGFYYQQVKAYLESFQNVKIYLFDDLISRPLDLIKDAFSFLGVNSQFIPDLEKKHNVSGIPKNKILHSFMLNENKAKDLARNFLKPFIGSEKLSEIRNKFFASNLEKGQMKVMTRKSLLDLYQDDINKLQVLLKQDLSGWLDLNNNMERKGK